MKAITLVLAATALVANDWVAMAQGKSRPASASR
jgi:hypothetical protein